MKKQISFMITAAMLTAFLTIALYTGSEAHAQGNMTNATAAAGANMTNATAAAGANMTNATAAAGANMTQPLLPARGPT
jgi:hypothetical protein